MLTLSNSILIKWSNGHILGKCHSMPRNALFWQSPRRKSQLPPTTPWVEKFLRMLTSRYLGVELTKDLDCGPHIQKITAKANKTLNMARRNLYSCSQKIKESAYISLVRPTLEYAQTVWDPYQHSHIDQVESKKSGSLCIWKLLKDSQCNIYERSIAVAHTSPKKMRS